MSSDFCLWDYKGVGEEVSLALLLVRNQIGAIPWLLSGDFNLIQSAQE